MEYKTKAGREVELDSLQDSIGQALFQSPTVFNFYLPEYQPAGVVADAGLYAPETQIMSGPMLIGYLNGLYSLVTYGLSSCETGFGTGLYMDPDVSCGEMEDDAALAFANSDGNLTWAPAAGADAANASAVVGELDVLLTAGRLNAFDRAIIEAAYAAELRRSGGVAARAVRVAQFLIAVTPEFTATNLNTLTATVRGGLDGEPTPLPSRVPPARRQVRPHPA